MTTIQIPLTKQDKERLTRLALQYGFSLQEFSRRILTELASEFPGESLADYHHSEALKASLNRAIRDMKSGRVHGRL